MDKHCILKNQKKKIIILNYVKLNKKFQGIHIIIFKKTQLLRHSQYYAETCDKIIEVDIYPSSVGIQIIVNFRISRAIMIIISK